MNNLKNPTNKTNHLTNQLVETILNNAVMLNNVPTVTKGEFLILAAYRNIELSQDEINELDKYGKNIPVSLLENDAYLGGTIGEHKFDTKYVPLQSRFAQIPKYSQHEKIPVKFTTTLKDSNLPATALGHESHIREYKAIQNQAKRLTYTPDIPTKGQVGSIKLDDKNYLLRRDFFNTLTKKTSKLFEQLKKDLSHVYQIEHIISATSEDSFIKLKPLLSISTIDYILIPEWFDKMRLDDTLVSIYYKNGGGRQDIELKNSSIYSQVKKAVDTVDPYDTENMFTPLPPAVFTFPSNKNPITESLIYKNRLSNKDPWKLNDRRNLNLKNYVEQEENINKLKSAEIYKQTLREEKLLKQESIHKLMSMVSWLAQRDVKLSDLVNLRQNALRKQDMSSVEVIEDSMMRRIQELQPNLWHEYTSSLKPVLERPNNSFQVLDRREPLIVPEVVIEEETPPRY